MTTHRITLTVNGEHFDLDVQAHHTLLQVLREQLVLTGTKNGCEAGECGACAVLMNGEPVNSCMVLAPEANGAAITTVEGLASDAQLDPLQEAFVTTGATQCGFCTPGFIVSAAALLEENINPTREEVRDWFQKHRNLCRCTARLSTPCVSSGTPRKKRSECA